MSWLLVDRYAVSQAIHKPCVSGSPSFYCPNTHYPQQVRNPELTDRMTNRVNVLNTESKTNKQKNSARSLPLPQ